ncbi:hypothetical protein TSUD_246540 [Trifolium subterraneum]|uniref:Uncharacterized protein n=1 Tax=Trifolium subterraneum TaxID=3900 RepID=A0A2Z6NLB4_TRISU|nr:hypothetical protein TSUD_246540 [Trifolium subterraneum]
MYDNDPKPFIFFGINFVYRNKAEIQRKKEFEAASAAFKDRLAYYKEHKIRTPIDIAAEFPILAPPLGNAGCTTPRRIDDNSRLRLTPLCNLALDKYNAENQGANFVLADILKAAHNSAGNNYITFLAAPEQEEDPSNNNNNNNSAATTFKARVWKRGSLPPKVFSCAVVKTA